MKYVPFLFFLLITGTGMSQKEDRSSPLSVVTSRYKNTYIKIVYSRPQKKGRSVFGSLVPFKNVWRTGANETTEITLTQDIMVQDSLLQKGTYSLFTIPDEDHWTIVFNADLGMWGSYNYNPEQDVLRIEAPVQTTNNVYESFTIDINSGNDKGVISLIWDKTSVSFPIQYIEVTSEP